MRLSLCVVLCTWLSAVGLAERFDTSQQLLSGSFFEAISETNVTSPSSDNPRNLFRRQTGCGSLYHACSALGAPQLCCINAAVCSADAVGNVACCSTNAVCTGLVGGGTVQTSTAAGGAGVVTSTVVVGVSSQAAVTTVVVVGVSQTTTTGGAVVVTKTVGATTTSSGATATGGFIVAAGTTVALLPSDATRATEFPWLLGLVARMLLGCAWYG